MKFCVVVAGPRALTGRLKTGPSRSPSRDSLRPGQIANSILEGTTSLIMTGSSSWNNHVNPGEVPAGTTRDDGDSDHTPGGGFKCSTIYLRRPYFYGHRYVSLAEKKIWSSILVQFFDKSEGLMFWNPVPNVKRSVWGVGGYLGQRKRCQLGSLPVLRWQNPQQQFLGTIVTD